MTDTLCRHCLSYAVTKCLETVSFREKVFIGLTVVCVCVWGATTHQGKGCLEGRYSRWLAGHIVTPKIIKQRKIQVDEGYKT